MLILKNCFCVFDSLIHKGLCLRYDGHSKDTLPEWRILARMESCRSTICNSQMQSFPNLHLFKISWEPFKVKHISPYLECLQWKEVGISPVTVEKSVFESGFRRFFVEFFSSWQFLCVYLSTAVCTTYQSSGCLSTLKYPRCKIDCFSVYRYVTDWWLVHLVLRFSSMKGSHSPLTLKKPKKIDVWMNFGNVVKGFVWENHPAVILCFWYRSGVDISARQIQIQSEVK